MRHLLRASIFAALPLLALDPTAALAASPSQTQCEADGGTFDNQSGTKVCVLPPDPVGNSENSGGNSQETQTTTSGQGNLGNKPAINCSGPPGQQDPACP